MKNIIKEIDLSSKRVWKVKSGIPLNRILEEQLDDLSPIFDEIMVN